MKIKEKNPPRVFSIGKNKEIQIKDLGSIHLDSDDLITLKTENESECDIVKKDWGFYAGGSVNDRLIQHGLKTALVKNLKGQYYMMLVEDGQEEIFQHYLQAEHNQVVCWLNDNDALKAITEHFLQQDQDQTQPYCACGNTHYTKRFIYHEPPAGETPFDLKGANYERSYVECPVCHHLASRHHLPLEDLYDDAYVNTSYGEKLEKTFHKIINLPEDQSDNKNRVKRITEYCQQAWTNSPSSPSALDIGSGLCVFLYELKQLGWDCTALDTTDIQKQHAEKVCDIKALSMDFVKDTSPNLQTYDLIALNKVLEHVIDPITMLAKTKEHLNPNGIVYIELPDGEEAAKDSQDREEFFIEHYHVYSFTSFSHLIEKAGLNCQTMAKIREPSGKYTLYAFATLE